MKRGHDWHGWLGWMTWMDGWHGWLSWLIGMEFQLILHIDQLRTDGRTDRLTLVLVKSLSRLKTNICYNTSVSTNCSYLLVDTGSMVNLLRQSTISDLKIPTSAINTDTKYLLKTADGKKSNAALGTLKLTLFFTNQHNVPVCVENVVFIIVSNDFKMSNRDNVEYSWEQFPQTDRCKCKISSKNSNTHWKLH